LFESWQSSLILGLAAVIFDMYFTECLAAFETAVVADLVAFVLLARRQFIAQHNTSILETGLRNRFRVSPA
jgi:hypothetical protein